MPPIAHGPNAPSTETADPSPTSATSIIDYDAAGTETPRPAHRLHDLLPCIPGYEILSVIGRGGMGIVLQARHVELQRIVALKMLRGVWLADPEFRERFQVEAEAIARLQHPNIIQVFGIGTVEARPGEVHPSPYLSLEYLDGGDLEQFTDAPQSPEFAARIVEKLARAAHAAHQVGVIHRDLKPANVLLTRTREPKVADFGLAKQLAGERDSRGRAVTQVGTVVGTPEYMAPEQVTGKSTTPAIDFYALGVILYELLTARRPCQGTTVGETMHQVMYLDPVPLRRLQPSVPRDLETICLKRDTTIWREVAVLRHGTNVYGLAYTRDGSRLACGCSDNTIRIWDTARHEEVGELRGHTAYVHSLAFSPDSTRLVSGSGDFTVRVWDTLSVQERAAKK